jgi:hypothetical protein
MCRRYPTAGVERSLHRWRMTDSVVLHGAPDELLRVAVAAHLARYKGLSRAHTSSDLQGFLHWCYDRDLQPLRARRADVELFVRWLEVVRRFKPLYGVAATLGGHLLLPHLRHRRSPRSLRSRLRTPHQSPTNHAPSAYDTSSSKCLAGPPSGPRLGSTEHFDTDPSQLAGAPSPRGARGDGQADRHGHRPPHPVVRRVD